MWKGEFAPFGQELAYQATENRYKFTGKERDAESGLDYFGARYYASTMGRFSSPDPSGLAYADPANPQSLNLYSYAQNNPLTNIDPTGLDCVYLNNSGDGIESVDRNSSGGECGSTGGDYVNGRLSGSQYFSGSDTFAFQSSDSSNRYLTYASAPGQQADGTTCAGDCNTANGYLQTSLGGVSQDPLNPYAQGVIQGVAQQTAPLYNGLNTVAGCVANNTILAPAAAVTSLLGAPVPKAAVFGRTAGMGGEASSYMSGASAAEVLATGGRSAKFTGTAAKVSRAVTGTARIGGAVGRVAGPVAVGLDAALIANCITGH